jgi:tRNA(Ile)-lysidine synthase TilS/MesJ
MEYKNNFGTINIFEDVDKFKDKTVAVAMSGGADSTMLCYLIANTINEQDLNITIQPYNGLDLWAPGDGH